MWTCYDVEATFAAHLSIIARAFYGHAFFVRSSGPRVQMAVPAGVRDGRKHQLPVYRS